MYTSSSEKDSAEDLCEHGNEDLIFKKGGFFLLIEPMYPCKHAGQTQNGISGKSEIQLDILGFNIQCQMTSSFFIFVKVSMLKEGKDVK
jgi:hypothetical protein